MNAAKAIITVLINFLGGFFLLSDARASDISAPATPFGVEIGVPGSCDQLRTKLGSPAAQEGNPGVFKVESPEKYFPNAIDIALVCQNSLAQVVLVSVRVDNYSYNVNNVLTALSRKYRLADGEPSTVDGNSDVYSKFEAGDSEVEVTASSSKPYFSIKYAHFDKFWNDLNPESIRQMTAAKLQRDAL